MPIALWHSGGPTSAMPVDPGTVALLGLLLLVAVILGRYK